MPLDESIGPFFNADNLHPIKPHVSELFGHPHLPPKGCAGPRPARDAF